MDRGHQRLLGTSDTFDDGNRCRLPHTRGRSARNPKSICIGCGQSLRLSFYGLGADHLDWRPRL
jgi:hypothetical protein